MVMRRWFQHQSSLFETQAEIQGGFETGAWLDSVSEELFRFSGVLD